MIREIDVGNEDVSVDGSMVNGNGPWAILRSAIIYDGVDEVFTSGDIGCIPNEVSVVLQGKRMNESSVGSRIIGVIINRDVG